MKTKLCKFYRSGSKLDKNYFKILCSILLSFMLNNAALTKNIATTILSIK